MKFAHGFVYQGFVYFFDISRGGIDKTGRSDIVDLPGHPTGIIVNQVFGFRIKGFIRAAGEADPAVDIDACLLLCEATL